MLRTRNCGMKKNERTNHESNQNQQSESIHQGSNERDSHPEKFQLANSFQSRKTKRQLNIRESMIRKTIHR